jgi:hypothetical protein
MSPGTVDHAQAELARAGHTLYEAFALGVELAQRQTPEAFGTVHDPEAFHAYHATVKIAWEKMRARLQEALTMADLAIGEIDAEGRATFSLRLTGGAVRLTQNWPDELMAWLAGQPDVRRALGIREDGR